MGKKNRSKTSLVAQRPSNQKVTSNEDLTSINNITNFNENVNAANFLKSNIKKDLNYKSFK